MNNNCKVTTIVINDNTNQIITSDVLPGSMQKLLCCVGKYAQLRLYQVITQSEFSIEVRLDTHAHIDYQAVITGAPKQQLRIAIYCNGYRSWASILLVPIAGANNMITITSLQYHDAPTSTSSIMVKGMAYRSAQVSYVGSVYVAKEAHQVDANQQSRFLIDGNKAQVHTQPMLEVLTNDVRCAHGSAIGHFDDAQLVYVAMRGVLPAKARALLAQAFLTEALDGSLQPVVHSLLMNKE